MDIDTKTVRAQDVLTPITIGKDVQRWGVNHDTGHGYVAVHPDGDGGYWSVEIVWDVEDGTPLPSWHPAKVSAGIDRGMTEIVRTHDRPTTEDLVESLESSWGSRLTATGF